MECARIPGKAPLRSKKHIADIYLEFLKAKGVSFTPLHPESHSLQTGDEWQIKFESTRKPRPLGRGVTGFTQAKFCFNLSEQEKSFAGDFPERAVRGRGGYSYRHFTCCRLVTKKAGPLKME